MTSPGKAAGCAAAAFAFAMLSALAACNQSGGAEQRAPRASNSTDATPPSPASQAPSAPQRDDTSQKPDTSTTANASDPPMKSMDSTQESTAMPRPGQNNDHSTVAGDSQKGDDKK